MLFFQLNAIPISWREISCIVSGERETKEKKKYMSPIQNIANSCYIILCVCVFDGMGSVDIYPPETNQFSNNAHIYRSNFSYVKTNDRFIESETGCMTQRKHRSGRLVMIE